MSCATLLMGPFILRTIFVFFVDNSNLHYTPCENCFRGKIEVYDGIEGDSHNEICPDCHGTLVIEKDAFECDCDECKRAYFVIVNDIYVARFVDQEEAVSYAVKLKKDCIVERGSGEPIFKMRTSDKCVTNFLRSGNPHLHPFNTD